MADFFTGGGAPSLGVAIRGAGFLPLMEEFMGISGFF
jgi:hypothetical protein